MTAHKANNNEASENSLGVHQRCTKANRDAPKMHQRVCIGFDTGSVVFNPRCRRILQMHI